MTDPTKDALKLQKDIFDPIALQREAQKALAIVPAGKRGALLGVVGSDGTARLHFAWRVHENWEVGAAAQMTWNHDLPAPQQGFAGKLTVIGSW